MINALLDYILLKIRRYKIASILTYGIIPIFAFIDKYFTGNFIGKTIIYLGNQVFYAPFLIVCYYIGFLWILFILDDNLSLDIKDRYILYFSGIKNYIIYRFFENSFNAILRNLLIFLLAIVLLKMSTLVILFLIILSFTLMMSTIPFAIISYCLALMLGGDTKSVYRVFNWSITIILPLFYSIIIYPKIVLWVLSILFPPAIFFEVIKQIIFARLVLDNLLLIIASISTIIWYLLAYLIFKKVWKEIRRKGLLVLV